MQEPPVSHQPCPRPWAGVHGQDAGRGTPTAPHLCGDQLEDQLAVSLNAGGAGAWFQLEPAVFTGHGHLLKGKGSHRPSPLQLPPTDSLWDREENTQLCWPRRRVVSTEGALRVARTPRKLLLPPPLQLKAPRAQEGQEMLGGVAGQTHQQHPRSMRPHKQAVRARSPGPPLTRTGMLRHPRKSSVWSSAGPAVPFARADLTICLKYLGKAGGGGRPHLGPWGATICWPAWPSCSPGVWGARGSHPSYLLMPFRPMTSFSFLHASTRDTSSSWSLGAGRRNLACLEPGWALRVLSQPTPPPRAGAPTPAALQGPGASTRCLGAAGPC